MLPRRKVPVGRLQPTGRMPGYHDENIAYEGPLERDFILLQMFDPRTMDIISQPFTIKYRNPSGRTYNSTPDFLVGKLDGPIDDRSIKKIVYEVRVKAQADPSDPTFAARFNAVAEYAATIGATHEVATEDDVRIPRLENAKLLLPHARVSMNGAVFEAAEEIVYETNGVSFDELIDRIRRRVSPDADIRSTLYRMLLNGFLDWNDDEKLTEKTLIYDMGQCPES